MKTPEDGGRVEFKNTGLNSKEIIEFFVTISIAKNYFNYSGY